MAGAPHARLTDLAFSLDSVTTAIALSRDVLVVLLGGTIGIITLRFMAQLFIRWLDEYEYLEDAGFITVAFVGIRLLLRVVNDSWVPPQWLMVGLIAAIFAWGFSKKTAPPALADAVSTPENTGAESADLVPTPELEPSQSAILTEPRQPAGIATAEGESQSVD